MTSQRDGAFKGLFVDTVTNGESLSRRAVLRGSAGLAAGAMTAGLFGCAADTRRNLQAVPSGERILLRGGTVLSMDPAIGDFDVADVLIEGSRIAAVGPNLDATAEIVDADNMIIMPGFVDTHRHMWQGQLRNILPNGLLRDYMRDITGSARSNYRPEDAYIGDLVTALGAINAGVTTVLDWSHIGNTQAHTDGAIDGLAESGVRGVYAYGGGTAGPGSEFPQDIRRLRAERFSTNDQLLTLALATGPVAEHWALAREVAAPITLHVNGSGALLPLADQMGPDVTYIHCPFLTEAEWQLVASTGGHISIAAPIEMKMGHGPPPVQQALDHGIRPSLSVDVETEMPGDFFTQMRSVLTLQRMDALSRQRNDEANAPELLTVRDVIEFATIQGAIDNALDDKVGTLSPGKEADILMLRADAINVMPLNNAYGAVVLSMDTSNVDSVFIAGQARKWQGELVDVDLGRIRRLLDESRDYVLSAAGWPNTRLGGYLPGH
jgi:cytosine/adenosine deaminase-related metal-dependent hydrolase